MTDPSGLTPEHDAVRRLLADARHDRATPPEVVARLDDTLASLAAERASTTSDPPVPTPATAPAPATAPVVDLGARRRRAARIGLLAAAAVVVAGLALGQALPRMQGSDDAGSSAGSAERDTSLAEAPELDDGGDGGADGGGDSSAGAEQGPQTKLDPSDAPTLFTSEPSFDEEVADLQRSTTGSRSDGLGSADALDGCSWRGVGPGRRVLARVDGQPGLVVFRRPSADLQDVAIYVCGDDEPVRTLTLPAP